MQLLFIFAALLLAGARAGAQEATIERYLFDSRIHAAVTPCGNEGVGQISWLDTISGEAGDARYHRQEEGLCVEFETGVCTRGYRVPDLAFVIHAPPWSTGSLRTSLGLRLD